VIGFALILGFALYVGFSVGTPNAAFQDAAAVLAFITGAAVGIERTIEGGWSVVDLISPGWPDAGAIGKRLNTTNQTLKSIIADVNNALEFVSNNVKDGKTYVDNAGEQLKTLQHALDQLKGTTAKNPNLLNLLSRAQDALTAIQAIDKSVEVAVGAAPSVLADLASFLATFKESPIRRLISLFFGVVIGLGLARLFNLDLIQAILQPTTNTSGGKPTLSVIFLYPGLGVVLTGLVIGLGSGPTHEAIKALQSYKQSQQGTSQS
jgi:hypothetical protein